MQKLVLVTSYLQDEQAWPEVNMLPALAFFPPNVIPVAFDALFDHVQESYMCF